MRTSLLELPTELLLQIVSHLDPISKFQVMQVAKPLRSIGGDYSCWKDFFIKEMQEKLQKRHEKYQASCITASANAPNFFQDTLHVEYFFDDWRGLTLNSRREHPIIGEEYQFLHDRISSQNRVDVTSLLNDIKQNFIRVRVAFIELEDSNSPLRQCLGRMNVVLQEFILNIAKHSEEAGLYVLNAKHLLELLKYKHIVEIAQIFEVCATLALKSKRIWRMLEKSKDRNIHPKIQSIRDKNQVVTVATSFENTTKSALKNRFFWRCLQENFEEWHCVNIISEIARKYRNICLYFLGSKRNLDNLQRLVPCLFQINLLEIALEFPESSSLLLNTPDLVKIITKGKNGTERLRQLTEKASQMSDAGDVNYKAFTMS